MTLINFFLSSDDDDYDDKTSSLSMDLNPVELDYEKFDYSMCLLSFNIIFPTSKFIDMTEHHDSFAYIHNDKKHSFKLSFGRHEIKSIARQIENAMHSTGLEVKLVLDSHTMKYNIKSHASVHIDFMQPQTVARVFGFEPQLLEGGILHVANHCIHSVKTETVRINCDLVSGSFHDGVPTHTLHEFHPTAVSEYKMIERTHEFIYLPIVKRRISSINITVINREGIPINLEPGARIHCRVRIKKEEKTQ